MELERERNNFSDSHGFSSNENNETNFITQQNFKNNQMNEQSQNPNYSQNRQNNVDNTLYQNFNQKSQVMENQNENNENITTVTIKKTTKKTKKKKKVLKTPSQTRRSQMRTSVNSGESFENEEDDDQLMTQHKFEKMFRMIKNAHIEKIKNYIYLKEINNAHDEIIRLTQEGKLDEAKEYERELNSLTADVIKSNMDAFSKTQLAKSHAMMGQGFNSFASTNRSNTKRGRRNMSRSERRSTEERKYNKNYIHKNVEDIDNEDEEEVEEEEETRIKKSGKKKKNKNKRGVNDNKGENEMNNQNYNNRLPNDGRGKDTYNNYGNSLPNQSSTFHTQNNGFPNNNRNFSNNNTFPNQNNNFPYQSNNYNYPPNMGYQNPNYTYQNPNNNFNNPNINYDNSKGMYSNLYQNPNLVQDNIARSYQNLNKMESSGFQPEGNERYKNMFDQINSQQIQYMNDNIDNNNNQRGQSSIIESSQQRSLEKSDNINHYNELPGYQKEIQESNEHINNFHEIHEEKSISEKDQGQKKDGKKEDDLFQKTVQDTKLLDKSEDKKKPNTIHSNEPNFIQSQDKNPKVSSSDISSPFIEQVPEKENPQEKSEKPLNPEQTNFSLSQLGTDPKPMKQVLELPKNPKSMEPRQDPENPDQIGQRILGFTPIQEGTGHFPAEYPKEKPDKIFQQDNRPNLRNPKKKGPNYNPSDRYHPYQPQIEYHNPQYALRNPKQQPQDKIKKQDRRPQSSKGPMINPSKKRYRKDIPNIPTFEYPRMYRAGFGSSLSRSGSQSMSRSKSKSKSKSPANILFSYPTRQRCFACDVNCSISRSGNSPNKYVPYLASYKEERKAITFYDGDKYGYYQYHSKLP